MYEANAARWGHDWIMFANPSYGSWEGASFGFNWKAAGGEKRKMKFDTMVDWRPAQ
jgi:acid phosphatase